MDCEPINLAVIGCGYWGPNLVRNFVQLRGVNVYALSDLNPSKAQAVARDYASSARIESNYRVLLEQPQIHAVVIATPAVLHFGIARDAVAAGKHVFVEKPLATSVGDCKELIRLAEQAHVVLMVGHVFRYNAAVRKIKEYFDQGLLGKVHYIYSRRLNLGRIQTDINAMWSFAPHDISILLHWLNEDPVRVSARGFPYLNSGVEDVVFVTMDFPSKAGAHMHLSWLDPRKVREMTIVGSQKMLVYDDVATEGKIQIYDKGVVRVQDSWFQYERSYAEFQMKIRYGDIIIPYLPFQEPLQTECQHFVDCIRSGTRPLTDGKEGLRLVRILEAAQASLEQGGIPVEVSQHE